MFSCDNQHDISRKNIDVKLGFSLFVRALVQSDNQNSEEIK